LGVPPKEIYDPFDKLRTGLQFSIAIDFAGMTILLKI